jgi:hypothetical protein
MCFDQESNNATADTLYAIITPSCERSWTLNLQL